MNTEDLQELVFVGGDIQIYKYFTFAGMAVAVWDYLLTVSDEMEYVWMRDRSWAFWLFILNRYSILLYKAWNVFTLVWPGYTQAVCNHTVKLEGYYFVFVIALGNVFLTMKVYALTKANKYAVIAFSVMVTSSLVTGIWLVSIPSGTVIQMPDIPLDVFRACIFTASENAEWAYRAQVGFADLIASACIVVFVFKLKASHGLSRLNRLMRTVLQDSILYFFVMVGFHIAIALFTYFTRPSARGFPPSVIVVLIPVMVSRLVISLRKAAAASLVQAWDGDHFTSVESGQHEMMGFATPQLSAGSSFPSSGSTLLSREPIRSSRPHVIASHLAV